MAERQYEIEQEFDEVESNVLMIEDDVARQVVEMLNQDLASFYVLHHQYHKHQWVVEGPQFRELEELFLMHAEQTEAAANELAERANALGGVPAATMRKQIQIAYLEEEPDGILGIRDMLERDVEAERTIANKLREQIQKTVELGDWGTESLLKTTLQATEKRASFVQKHLERESLDRGLVSSQPTEEPIQSTIDQ